MNITYATFSVNGFEQSFNFNSYLGNTLFKQCYKLSIKKDLKGGERMSWLHIMIFIPFIYAIIIPLLYKLFNHRFHTGWLVLPIPILIFVYLTTYITTISNGEVLSYTLSWIPSLDIHFTTYLDGLSLIFGLIITGIGALVILYSIYYMSREREALNNFYVYLCLFMGAMLGVVFSDHVLVLYVFWELTSISSFLLIAYWFQRKQSRYGAQKALLITVFGGLMMLMGFIMLYMMSGTYSIRETITLADQLITQTTVHSCHGINPCRCFYKISTVSVQYLVARCDGGTYSN